MTRRRFVILDRDGTLIVHHRYLSDPAKVELIPGVAWGLRRLRALNLGLVVTTNQSAVARGLLSLENLEAIHGRLKELLSAEGIVLDGIYVCPHLPRDGCRCRKPKPGLLLRAARELGFEPRECYVVGDNTCDVELGRSVEATTIFLRTPYGAPEAPRGPVPADYTVCGFEEAVERISRLVRGDDRA